MNSHTYEMAGDSSRHFVLNWFWYAFDIAKHYFGRGNVTTIPNLSQSKLAKLPMKKLKIVLQDKQEQNKIAACFKSLDQKIVVTERKAPALQELFRVLLHDLMTAKTRANF